MRQSKSASVGDCLEFTVGFAGMRHNKSLGVANEPDLRTHRRLDNAAILGPVACCGFSDLVSALSREGRPDGSNRLVCLLHLRVRNVAARTLLRRVQYTHRLATHISASGHRKHRWPIRINQDGSQSLGDRWKLIAAKAHTVSLVAEVDGAVIGHIAFSPATISDCTQGWYGLGPVSVLPVH
jgi:hypothetical protein